MSAVIEENMYAGKFLTTYETLNDFLFEKTDRNNDMDCDGDGYMLAHSYCTSYDDPRDGISIDLHFKIVEPVPGVTEVEDNGQDAAIVLLAITRTAEDHEWEEFSEEELSIDGIETYDDLLKLIKANEQPRGEEPDEED